MSDQIPSSRPQGPLVWLDMDQRALDAAYNQAVYAPNMQHVLARGSEASARSRKALGQPQRLRYGPSDFETMDLYRTKSPNAPIAVYIQGGGWRRTATADCHAPAEMFTNSGAHYIAVDFANVDTCGGSLFPVVEQVRRAVANIYEISRDFGGDPSRLYVLGHSSGAHLASCVIITDWARDFGLSGQVVAGALLCSGMYDLAPVRLSNRSEYVKFTDAMVADLSAIGHVEKIGAPLIIGYGTEESPEFQRQAREFEAALIKAGKPYEIVIGTGYNHFEMNETIANPFGLICDLF